MRNEGGGGGGDRERYPAESPAKVLGGGGAASAESDSPRRVKPFVLDTLLDMPRMSARRDEREGVHVGREQTRV